MLKKQLWITCQQTSHQETIENQAATIYRKLVKRMKQAALYGKSEILAPPAHLDEYVQEHVIKLLHKDGLRIDNRTGKISWKPLPDEEQIPILTGRELVQSGYNPGDGDLFNRILQALQQAIVRGEVGNDLVQAQLIWVNEHFSK